MPADPPAPFRWTFGAWAIIGVVALIWASHWHRFPIFLDSGYHLHVVSGFARAGGVALHDAWEYAPDGRPHLYPPLVHLLLLALVRAGMPLLTAGRVATALAFPALLAALWAVSRGWSDRRTAWWTVVAALVPYTWMLQASAAWAGAAASVLTLLLFGAVERERAVAAACWLGLAWYAHLGMPWVTAGALVVYAALRPERRGVVIRALIGGVAIALPWLVHLFHHRAALAPQSLAENRFVEYYPTLYLLAAWGAWLAWRDRGATRIGIALTAASLLMLPLFRYRLFSGEGLLGPVLLAGCALASLPSRLVARLAPRWFQGAVLALALVVWAVAPSIAPSRGGAAVAWRESVPWRLATWLRQPPKGNDVEMYDRWMADTVERVRRLTAPGEVIWCNYRHVASLLGALADRATSAGALGEVAPHDIGGAVASAALLVWINDPEPSMELARDRLLQQYSLTLVEQTDFATFYRQAGATARAMPGTAAVPAPVAWSLLAGVIGIGLWDCRRA